MNDIWARNNPDAVAEIIEIAGTMSPVRRDRVVLEYARRHGLDLHPDKYGTPQGPAAAWCKGIVTRVLDTHPAMFQRWSGTGSKCDKIWMVKA